MVKLIASYDIEIGAVVLGNAPQNAKYTSPSIQKEILHIIDSNVQTEIHKEIGDESGMNQRESKWQWLFVLLIKKVSLENIFLILFMFWIRVHLL
jgi:hypothetical protein